MASSTEGLAGALDFLQEIDNRTEGRFIELARDLTNALYVLLRSAGLYDLQNEAMSRPYTQIITTANELRTDYNQDISIQLVDGNLFVNQRLLPLDFATFTNVRYLRRIFEFLDINELAFIDKLTRPRIITFLQSVMAVIRDRRGTIGDYPLEGIRVRKLAETKFDELRREDDPRKQILGVYAAGLLMLRQYVNDLRRGRSPRHAMVKRLCLELIDLEPRFHNMLIALVHLEAYKGNLFSRMLNTAALSVVFGRRLGLNRKQLVTLGMSAFNHDLGWALLGAFGGDEGEDDLNMDGIEDLRSGAANIDETRTKVARSLLRLGGFNELVINRLIVAFECQVSPDRLSDSVYIADIGSNYVTQIVRMAARYDQLTSPSPTRKPLMPDQAMKAILDDGGNRFEVFWAKLFANCIGIYPVGTLVELDTTEVGLVVNLPTNPINFHRPQIRILVDRMGQPQPAGAIVDLSETYRGGNKYMRTIERTLDSREYGLSITQFFFG